LNPEPFWMILFLSLGEVFCMTNLITKGGLTMVRKLMIVCLAVFLLHGVMSFSPSGVQRAQAAEPIVIGVPTSLYTPFGSYGLKAVNLAVEEINAKGGVKVGNQKRLLKVVVSDTRGGEPGTPVHDALMAYEKLITEQKPDAIVIGAFRSEVLIAAMDLVAKYKVPHLGTIAQTPQFQAQFKKDPAKYKYLFRVTTDALVDATYIAHTLDLLKKDFNLDKILYIYQDTLWAKAFAGLMQKHCAQNGWTEIGFEPYADGASDFSPALMKAKESKAQVIGMVWDVPLGAGVFAKQYVAMRVPALLIGFIPPLGSPMAARAVGPEVEYSITVEFPVGATLALAKLPKTGQFLDKFKKKYGEIPDPPAVNSSAYDSVFVLAAAIEKAGSLDPDRIVAALEQTDYPGVSGRIKFNQDHVMIFGEKSADETGMCVVFQWQKSKDGSLKRVPVYPESLAERKILLPPWMEK
jgi:branched-chain amino acid transport system substrate-binding protein